MGQQSIQVKRYGQILGRLLSMSGVEDVAGDLSPEISPVLVLEADRPEWLFLAGQFLLAGAGVQVALAANPSFFRIRNPVGSGIIAVVESIDVSAAAIITDGVATIGTATIDRANVMGSLVRDTRWGSIVGTCLVSNDNGGSVGSGIERFRAPINTGYRFNNMPVVLAPGSHLDYGANDSNIELHVNIRWRERPAEPYELKS